MLKGDNTSCFSIRITNEDLQPMNSFLLRQRYYSLGISSKFSLSCLPTTTLISTNPRINDSDYPAGSIDSTQNLLFHPERLISRLRRALVVTKGRPDETWKFRAHLNGKEEELWLNWRRQIWERDTERESNPLMILDTRVVERKASPPVEDRRGKKKGKGRKRKEERGKRKKEREMRKEERGRRKRRRWLARSAGICITKRAINKVPGVEGDHKRAFRPFTVLLHPSIAFLSVPPSFLPFRLHPFAETRIAWMGAECRLVESEGIVETGRHLASG